MKIRLIEDGNFPSWFRLLLIIVGVAIAVMALYCNMPLVLAKISLLVGFGIALVGGMASRAVLLKIKPFDSSYKKARKSYESEKDDKGAGR